MAALENVLDNWHVIPLVQRLALLLQGAKSSYTVRFPQTGSAGDLQFNLLQLLSLTPVPQHTHSYPLSGQAWSVACSGDTLSLSIWRWQRLRALLQQSYVRPSIHPSIPPSALPRCLCSSAIYTPTSSSTYPPINLPFLRCRSIVPTAGTRGPSGGGARGMLAPNTEGDAFATIATT